MSWTLEQAKEDLGIPPEDTSKDAAIQRQMDAVLAAAETYCQRNFLFERETAYFPALHGPILSLRRYPVGQIYAVTYAGLDSSGTLAVRILQPDTGLITASYGEAVWRWSGWSQNISVDYDGGYSELPPDLEMALWEMFQIRWAATGGAGSMTELGQAVSSEDVRSITIPNVISATMANGGAGQGGSSLPSIGALAHAYAGTLDLYRRVII